MPAPVAIRRVGRPSLADDLALELVARRAEEQEMDRQAAPLIRRLHAVAHDYSPEAEQTVAALEYLHRRHARRWALEEAA